MDVTWIDLHVQRARHHLENIVYDNQRQIKNHNLTKTECTTIETLNQNQDINIKLTDNGGLITVMYTANNKLEAELHLYKTNFYKPSLHNPMDIYKSELIKVSYNLSPDTKTTINWLIPPNPKRGIFYTTPKLHKLPKIVS